MNLFVSYAHGDNTWVKKFVKGLGNDGFHKVWMDTSTLVAGQDWWVEILQGIEKADCFIAILTPKFVGSIFCSAELNYAYSLNIPILPLILNPNGLIYPDIINKHRIHATDVSRFSLDRTLLICERSFNRFEHNHHLYKRLDPLPNRPSIPELPKQQASPEQVIEIYELAETQWLLGNLDEAEKLFNQVITGDPHAYGVAALERLSQLRFERQRDIDFNGIVRLMENLMLRKEANPLSHPLWKAFESKYGLASDHTLYVTRFTMLMMPKEPPHDISLPKSKPIITAAQQRLLDIMLDWQHYDPVKRAEAGRQLAEIGDPRSGVGLQRDGLPDIVWCEVSGGKVKLGGDKVADSSLPEQIINLPTFYIAQYPITYLQFQAFLSAEDGFTHNLWWKDFADHQTEANEQHFKYANHPRENVSWYDSIAFCRWLSRKLGYEITLPTEQQWEKTARGTDGSFFPWGNKYEIGYANIDETEQNNKVGNYYLNTTTAVGLYPHGKSPYKVLDLIGNVWEWTLTEWERNYFRYNDPYVLRGGAWLSNRGDARAALRYRNIPDNRNNRIGFRVVCSRPY